MIGSQISLSTDMKNFLDVLNIAGWIAQFIINTVFVAKIAKLENRVENLESDMRRH